jgi:hypothetical protein
MKSLYLFAAMLVACQGSDPATDDSMSTAEEGLGATQATADVVTASALFDGATTVAQAEGGVAAAVTVPACVTIASDHATYLEATFHGCTGARGRVALDGTLRADLSVDGAAVVYALSTDDLTVGETAISGSWEVRDPVAAGAATTLSGTLTIERGGRTLTYEAGASWTVSGECVTYSFDASVEAGGRSLSVAGEGVERCVSACPAAGTVSVAAGAGGTLSWTFDASTSIAVTGPHGEHQLTLVCGRPGPPSSPR